MIGMKVKVEANFPKVEKAAEKASFRNIQHAAATIRKTAIASIEPSNEPSRPGQPPHTRIRVTKKGKQLKGQLPRSIVFYQDKAANEAIVGPRGSIVGPSAAAHEFGGSFRGDAYPARPFMGPSLDENLGRFADSFEGSIRG